MVEFVSRNLRLESAKPYEIDYSLISKDENRPKYGYVRIAKINENFPVFDYAGPGVVAFMDPDNVEIAIPTWERMPYGAKDHAVWHETEHVFAKLNNEDHHERGFNDRAVEGLRQKTGYNFFPFPSY